MTKVLILLAVIFSSSVFAVEQCEMPVKQVSLSFDDDLAVDSVYDNLYLFERYNAKITLYVSKWPKLTDLQKSKLRAIQAAGHEIGNHGLWHKAATDYTPEQHKSEQVDPAIPYARSIGLGIWTFAYPFGSRTPLHDEALLNGAYWAVRGFETQYSEIRPSAKPSITAYSIDEYHLNLNLVYNAIDTMSEGETVYLATHVIGEWSNDWRITTENLEAILSYGSSNGVKFCTVKDC